MKKIKILLLGMILNIVLVACASNATESTEEKEARLEPEENTIDIEEQPPEEDLLVNHLSSAMEFDKIMIVHTETDTDTEGTFDYYEKVDNEFQLVLSTTCYVGREGIGEASEYSTKTPTGRFTFTKLFGIAEDPGTIMEYKVLDDNDYWCGETYYNQFVDEDVMEHDCSKENDEHLAGAIDAYQYVAAFNYNESNTEGEGFAFFLHNMNGYPYTDGCISISMEDMEFIETVIDENTCIIIDLDENLEKY